MITKTQLYLLMLLPQKIRKSIDVDKNGCWLWNKSQNRNGYGRFCHSGSYTMAHRFIYKFLRKTNIDDYLLDHIYSAKFCKRHCCNPTHLSPVTHRTNTHRGKAILFKTNK